MLSRKTIGGFSGGLLLMIAATGCSQKTEQPFSILDPLGLGRAIFGLGVEPVRVGITMVHASQGSEAPWAPIQRQMQWSLNRPVQFESLRPFQIKAHLGSGRIQFAMVRAGEQKEILDEPGVGSIIAEPEFEEWANRDRALLIVSADSNIRSIEQLKGKRIAFGPIGDRVTHLAALEMLEANGIPRDSIPRELLPIPGMFKHHISSFETAIAAIYERVLGLEAGFVHKRDYEKWPETGGSLLLLSVSKDQLVILGETEPVPSLPEGPVLASAKADEELVEHVTRFLTVDLPRNKKLCSRLGLRRYTRAPRDAGRTEIPETRTASEE